MKLRLFTLLLIFFSNIKYTYVQSFPGKVVNSSRLAFVSIETKNSWMRATSDSYKNRIKAKRVDEKSSVTNAFRGMRYSGTPKQILAITDGVSNTLPSRAGVEPYNSSIAYNLLSKLADPTITTNPNNSSVCEGVTTSFSITATNATGYQWQVDSGSGFINVTNNATYSGATTASLTINTPTISLNNYQYRCVANNGSVSATSNAAALIVTPLPIRPTLVAKVPNSNTVDDGTTVSATFNAGSGGIGCADEYRYTINGGATYFSYTPGASINTTGVAAGTGMVFIEGRRANCSGGCQGTYVVLASWVVTPLPTSATTLNAGDIAFSGYTSTSSKDDFSFVLLKNVGPSTVINFTDNGWLSVNNLQTGESIATWTAPAGGLPSGTEIMISGLTASRSDGGSAGTVTGTALDLSPSGDQILAYRGTAASPTFISAIHMNVNSTSNGDSFTTTPAAWDGTANTPNSSALPTGLTTGVNCIWIGVQGDVTSEHRNAKFDLCNLPAVAGSTSSLKGALNNRLNWTVDDNSPPAFSLPTGCNYLKLVPTIVSSSVSNSLKQCLTAPSAEQTFSVSGYNLNDNIIVSAPAPFEISSSSGAGFGSSITLTPSGGSVPVTTIYVRLNGSNQGLFSTNIMLTSSGATTNSVSISGEVAVPPTIANSGSNGGAICGTSVQLQANTPTSGTGIWSALSGAPGTVSFNNINDPNTTITIGTSGTYTMRWTISTGSICANSTSDVTFVFNLPPSTAEAGTDINTCVGISSVTMAAAVPARGTGTWSQQSGPATATITSVNSPTTTISGLTAVGTYRFVWTVSTGVDCNSSDVVEVVANTPPSRLYVNALATGQKTGLTWADAFTDLQLALNYSCNSNLTEIWVAAGTYKPTADPSGNTNPTDARTKTFVMKNGVAIYGGFNGTETQLSERNWRTNATILSGNIGDAGVDTDNTYRVINNNFTSGSPLNNTAILDGFIVEKGYANGGFPMSLGGGMWNANAAPLVRNCVFRSNFAVAGGGMFNADAQPTITNCLFLNNTTTDAGAGIANGGGTASTKIMNCTFYGNTGINTINNQSSVTITNCIIWGNGGGISGGTVTYSNVQGGFSGTGNLNIDPRFVNASNGDFRLQQCSPAIDAGTATDAPATDFVSSARVDAIAGARVVDMGAFEYQSTYDVCTVCLNLTGGIVYVNASAAGSNNGSSWENAFTDLQLALSLARTYPSCVSQIWVAQGTYRPTSGTDRTISFSMVNGVAIYGGFPNTGNPTMTDRNWASNVTTLSGDIDGTADVVTGTGSTLSITGNNGNSYHVIFNSNNGLTTTNSLLDGFTITGGNANGSGVNNDGGGMFNYFSSPSLSNVTFSGNQADNGGGMFNQSLSSPNLNSVTFSGNIANQLGGGMYNDNSSPGLSNVNFSGNQANQNGGGMCNFGGSPSFSNVTFSSNQANNGGGMFSQSSSSPNLNNITFSGNIANQSGGGMYNDNSSQGLSNVNFLGNQATFGGGMFNFGGSPSLSNVTFSGNQADQGGGMYNYSSNPVLKNSILWGNSSELRNDNNSNPVYTYCLIQGLNPGGTGNLDGTNPNNNPLFVSQPSLGLGTAGDLRLRLCSPAINAGDPATTSATVGNVDLGGNPRFYNSGRIDIGAYEYQGTFDAVAPAVQVTNSVCTTFGGTASGGVISAPSSSCPAGSTLYYSTDNGGNWSKTLPTYAQAGPAQTIVTRCTCDANPATFGPTSSVTTVPGTCPACPDLTVVAPAVQVTNSVCTTFGGTASGGVISAPSNSCPAGSTLYYSTDNGGNWSKTLPTYAQVGPAQTIVTRCTCDANANTSSPTSSVTTIPGGCPECPVLTSDAPSIQVTNSVCTTFGGTPSGGVISAPSSSCPAGSTLYYSTDNGGNWSKTLPTYAQVGPAQTIVTRCTCDANPATFGPTSTVTTVPGVCPECPVLTSAAPAVQVTNSVCATFGGTPSGGLISVPSSSCPAGSTLFYSTDNGGNWSKTLPTYAQTGPAQTIVTRCTCDANANTSSPTSSVTTIPGVCPDCPVLTSAAPAVQVTNSVCQTGCVIGGGNIAVPSTSCPVGSTLQYQLNGGGWSTTLPTYVQTGPAQTIKTRCVCNSNASQTSPESSVTTVPGTVPALVVPANGSAVVSCAALATLPVPPVVNDCSGAPISPSSPIITDSPDPLTCEGTRTYTYTYVCGTRTASWSFVYTIEREAFTISVPNGSATVYDVSLAVAPVPPKVLSQCGETLTPSAPVITNSPNPLVCEGTRTYTYTYTDCEGNTASWSYVYTILDNIAPTIACPGNIVVCEGTVVRYTPPVGTDNCTGAVTTQTSGLGTGVIYPVGVTTNTYKVTASNGQTAECSFTVTVISKPTITLSTLQQTLNEGNSQTFCDIDANPINSLQFRVTTGCVVGTPVWRVQVGSGAWSEWSTNPPATQLSNNQPHRYQAACDASCPVTYTSPISVQINYRASTPQQVSLIADGITVNEGESKEVCNIEGNNITFNATCAAGEIVLYSVDGDDYNSVVPTQLVDGQYHNYRVRCRKSDGTVSCIESESGVMRLKITSGLGQVPVASLNVTSGCGTPASFSGTASCGSLTTVWYNASTNGALPTLPSQTPKETTSYYARCQAGGGCLSEKSNIVTFTVIPVSVAPVITASQEIVCTGTTVRVSANCPAGSQTFWNTGVTTPSFEVAFNNVTKQTYWAKCIFEGGCQSSESVHKDIYWNAFVVTMINVGQSKSAVKPANEKAWWSSQFITKDGGPELEQSTQTSPTLYYVENPNKVGPRYWTINVDACGLGTNGSLTFDLLATPETGVPQSFNTHENNAPYFMYANREGWTELYAQNHPAYGFYQDNGVGGNTYDSGLPKGLYKLGIRYWDQKGWGSIYPSTRQPQGNVLAYQEYWFRIQSKDGIGAGAARSAVSDEQGSDRRTAKDEGQSELLSNNGQRLTDNIFAQVMPNPVTNILRLQVQDSKGQVVQTTLTDASGRRVLSRQFVPETHSHQEEFGLSELPSGMYFLKVNTPEKQTTLKVVKVE